MATSIETSSLVKEKFRELISGNELRAVVCQLDETKLAQGLPSFALLHHLPFGASEENDWNSMYSHVENRMNMGLFVFWKESASDRKARFISLFDAENCPNKKMKMVFASSIPVARAEFGLSALNTPHLAFNSPGTTFDDIVSRRTHKERDEGLLREDERALKAEQSLLAKDDLPTKMATKILKLPFSTETAESTVQAILAAETGCFVLRINDNEEFELVVSDPNASGASVASVLDGSINLDEPCYVFAHSSDGASQLCYYCPHAAHVRKRMTASYAKAHLVETIRDVKPETQTYEAGDFDGIVERLGVSGSSVTMHAAVTRPKPRGPGGRRARTLNL